eukprot:NODE_1630_length_1464_cov_395.661484_g1472_i0.p1 GENE.NODE_1630_length_1464_cov_395.661484_g1472_i0~~NODE_1630_length_1464_cov_395.661484_g1472_i0.p1  ORF type:complete len:437 (-),score=112.19 NODE_1630_length_1464_cov_395.661484_g1472_i0:154-1401(-)
MPLKLYTAKGSPRSQKVIIVASIVGAELEFPNFEFGKDNKSDDFLAKHPLQKVPVLETPEGYLFESNAICKYLARLDLSKGLLGTTDYHQAKVDQWLDFCTSELEPAALGWLGPLLGYRQYNAAIEKESIERMKSVMKALNYVLERTSFLVGDRLGLADIVIASTLVPLYARVFDPRFRTPFPCVNRWFETVSQQDFFKAVQKLDPMAWCTVMQKVKVQKAEKKEAKEEKKQKPKEEKKKKEEAIDEEEDEDEAPKEEKKANPLDLLPKSSFVLDAFKREYSNNPVEHTMKYLAENFDAEGFTMWWCNYKYNEECTALFRTSNLIGGFYQRLERMHKYAFGQMLIVGEDKQHEITGFWIIRGDKIPDTMLDVPDTELYDWVKVEGGLAANSEKIKNFMNWDPIDGKACLDGKTFK